MLLRVNSLRGTLVIPTQEIEDIQVEFGRYYDMPDAKGFRVIFRKFNDFVVIEIRQGKKLVQSGSIPFLSTIIGYLPKGGPRHGFYEMELSPETPIFPAMQLVKTLFGMGLESVQITPMFERELEDCAPLHGRPKMFTDGTMDASHLPAHGDLMDATEFTVWDASWAVRSHDDRIGHVYIWPAALTSESTAALLDHLRQITAGELMSV